MTQEEFKKAWDEAEQEKIEKAWEKAEKESRVNAVDVPEEDQLIPRDSPDYVSSVVVNVVQNMVSPILESVGKLLKNNTEAIEQIAGAIDVMQNRMTAMEKQMRLATPVTDRQAKYLNDAARNKAREILDKKGFAEDKKAVTKLAGIIRKSVMARQGCSIREIPRVEYNVAMNQIETWNNVLDVMEIVKEARRRKEAASIDSTGVN